MAIPTAEKLVNWAKTKGFKFFRKPHNDICHMDKKEVCAMGAILLYNGFTLKDVDKKGWNTIHQLIGTKGPIKSIHNSIINGYIGKPENITNVEAGNFGAEVAMLAQKNGLLLD